MYAIKISKEKEAMTLRESKWQMAREDLREERKGQNSGSLTIPLPRLRRTSRMPSKNEHTINKLIITQTSMELHQCP